MNQQKVRLEKRERNHWQAEIARMGVRVSVRVRFCVSVSDCKGRVRVSEV